DGVVQYVAKRNLYSSQNPAGEGVDP
ncbi:nicotinic acid mononucleotide adenylyltransferase, partial [Mycobacterium sp. ITM-2017-0098]